MQNNDERLVKAAISGDVRIFEERNITTWCNSRGISSRVFIEALQYAVWNGHASFVKELLQIKYVPPSLWRLYEGKFKDEEGWYFYGAGMMSSPLHLAVKEGHLELVKQFLDFFQLNKVLDRLVESTATEWTAEHTIKVWFRCLVRWAVRWGHSSVIQLLLTPPFLLPTSTAQDFKMELSVHVHVAAHYKNLDVLKLFLEMLTSFPDKVTVRGYEQEDGLTALHLAAQSGSSCVVEFLLTQYRLKGGSVNARSEPDLFTPLHMAANSGRGEVVRLLLQSFNRPADHDQAQDNWEVDLLAQDRMGRTALHYAAREGHHHVLQLLLNCSTDSGIAGIPDHDGLLPLHMAARAGHVQVIKILKRHAPAGGSSSVDSVARHRFMMKHCFNSQFTAGFELGNKKFPRPNQIDSLFWKTEGFTPLHFAARYGHEAAVRELLDDSTDQIKPNLHLRDHAGFLAFDWLLVQNKSKFFLKCAKARQGTAVVAAIQQASCVRKMTNKMRSNIAENIDEEKKAMEELQCAWKSDTRPRLTMRLLQWVMEPDDNLSEYILPSNIYRSRDVNDDTSLLMSALRLDRQYKYQLAKEILLLLDPQVVLDHCVAKRVKQLLMEEVSPYRLEAEAKAQREFLTALVKYDKQLAGASNLLRWMLPCAQREKKYELVEAILDKPELKRGLYEDRQVYLDCANAILVGAALIGGVAFQAWLQPPLGYNYVYEGMNYAEVHEGAVRMFWRFNNAAFFFSVAALIAGAKGAVPVAHVTGIVESVEKVRRAVAVASTLLGVALVCVVGAFVEAGLAVLPPIPSDLEIMHTSAVWGGILCSLALLWFSLSVWPLLRETVGYSFKTSFKTVGYSFNTLWGFVQEILESVKDILESVKDKVELVWDIARQKIHELCI